ncbi:hypothetical protein D9M71_530010 [compost metagenome]
MLDQRAVGQRLAAEEDHAVALLVGRLLEQHFHRGLGGFRAHLLAGRGLVQVFLVAVGAAQVAAGVDVQHHGIQRGAFDSFHADFRRQRRAVADHFQRDQLAQGFIDFLPGETPGQALHQLLRRAALLAQGVDDAAGDFVGGEQRAAGDVEQHAVGIHPHFVQVAFDQIQDCAHGDLPELFPIVVANPDGASRPGPMPVKAAAGCSSVAR